MSTCRVIHSLVCRVVTWKYYYSENIEWATATDNSTNNETKHEKSRKSFRWEAKKWTLNFTILFLFLRRIGSVHNRACFRLRYFSMKFDYVNWLGRTNVTIRQERNLFLLNQFSWVNNWMDFIGTKLSFCKHFNLTSI